MTDEIFFFGAALGLRSRYGYSAGLRLPPVGCFLLLYVIGKGQRIRIHRRAGNESGICSRPGVWEFAFLDLCLILVDVGWESNRRLNRN
jgi:hypothetical protein